MNTSTQGFNTQTFPQACYLLSILLQLLNVSRLDMKPSKQGSWLEANIMLANVSFELKSNTFPVTNSLIKFSHFVRVYSLIV